MLEELEKILNLNKYTLHDSRWGGIEIAATSREDLEIAASLCSTAGYKVWYRPQLSIRVELV